VPCVAAQGKQPVPDERVTVEVQGRRLTLSNLSKVLYPSVGFTKAEVLDYYTRAAPAVLAATSHRALTTVRYPNGVDGPSFFEKNAPSHTPDWVRTVNLPAPGSSRDRGFIDYVVLDDVPTLVYEANLAALELHVPQWRVDDQGGPLPPDLLVIDLDPGPPAGVLECAAVALLLRDRLAADGLTGWPKTSGSKGLQISVPIRDADEDSAAEYAKRLAGELARDHPTQVVATMAKSQRTGRVYLDWSQNRAAKTTIAAYSLRARERPTVSTPLSWGEVAGATSPGELTFDAAQVLERLERLGDLQAALHDEPRPLPRVVTGE
jgi:bifunctional non-homologous end joining protein LigD